jgi:hypothetical protein
MKAHPSLNKDIALVGVGKKRRCEVWDTIRWLDVTAPVFILQLCH